MIMVQLMFQLRHLQAALLHAMDKLAKGMEYLAKRKWQESSWQMSQISERGVPSSNLDIIRLLAITVAVAPLARDSDSTFAEKDARNKVHL